MLVELCSLLTQLVNRVVIMGLDQAFDVGPRVVLLNFLEVLLMRCQVAQTFQFLHDLTSLHLHVHSRSAELGLTTLHGKSWLREVFSRLLAVVD